MQNFNSQAGPFTLPQTEAPLFAVHDGGQWPNRGRCLFALRVVDGHVTAEYDPADLDEAAERFVKAITEKLNFRLAELRAS